MIEDLERVYFRQFQWGEMYVRKTKDGGFYPHRVGGPAIIYTAGGQEWWVNSRRHREDGPAIEGVQGIHMKAMGRVSPSYFLFGEQISEAEYKSTPIADLILKIQMIRIIET